MASEYGNDYLDNYLQMVEDTESPRVFHLWSALSAVSACMGRRLYFPFGNDALYGNMYVLLVGNAATRKSTAMNIAAKIVRRMTSVKFAQDDCSGKRQGIIALMADKDAEEEEKDSLTAQLTALASFTPETLAKITVGGNTGGIVPVRSEDAQCLYVASSEFNTFIGHGNIEFLEFLGKMYDGESYEYKLKSKKEQINLDHPLISLIGCTTPTNIAEAMPAAAIGQGFTSRIILVYGAKKHKSVPSPAPFDKGLLDSIERRITKIYFDMHGEITETKDAKDYRESIYEFRSDLTDGRFSYYLARRNTHLIKVSMVLAVSRGSQVIERMDYELGHTLLLATEKSMPDALGEYGMSAMSVAKQKVVDAIMAANEPVTSDMLYAFMHRDLRNNELAQILNELTMAGKVQCSRSEITGKIIYFPFQHVSPEKLELMDLIATAPSTETKQ